MSDHQITPPKANILVVDDTPANLRLLAGILTEQGYTVQPAREGSQALSIAQGVSLDLIVLDIMMPEMDGYEVASRLKADERTKDIPVIFISASTDVLDKVKAFGVGGVDYITKPFQVEEVLARVETHLALQHLQKSLRDKNEELAKTEVQNCAILSAIPDLIYRVSSLGIYLSYVAPCELIDLLPSNFEPVGKHISEFLPPEVSQRHIQHLQQALATGKSQIYQK